MKQPRRLAFIGGGNMASAMLKGIVQQDILQKENIWVYDIDGHKLETVTKELGVQAADSNVHAVSSADIIVLAVKPVYAATVVQEIKDALSEDKILISIMAGISSEALQTLIDHRCPVVRTMPNAPAFIGEGMSVICQPQGLKLEDFEMVQALFKSFGRVEVIEERLMDAATAMSGSSPAYVFLFIEAMADGGVRMGLPRDVSYRLAAQAVQGAARMVLESGMHPGVLKDMVTSPGGTTIEALSVLEEYGLRSMMMEAIKVCADKSAQLGKKQ